MAKHKFWRISGTVGAMRFELCMLSMESLAFIQNESFVHISGSEF